MNARRGATLASFAVIGLGAAFAAAAPAWADTAGTDDAASARATQHRSATVKANRSRAKPAPPKRVSTPQPSQTASPTLTVRSAGQSPFVLDSGSTAAAELSGISYGGGTAFYAVGDNGAKSIWQNYTSLNGMNGQIRSSSLTGAIAAPDLGTDSEGIAFRPGTNSVWVADEIASSITEFSLADGQRVGSVPVPAIFAPGNVQNNMGLESLAYGAGTLWTANEEALKSDGALSTTTAGSWVRVQKFTGPDFAAAGQYAYRTDPIAEMSPFISVERSGLVDLIALPDGQVLTLERELGGVIPFFRSRIYLLDFTGATNVSSFGTLSTGGFIPVGKTLLWEGVFGFSNFEGMTLGPRNRDGTYSIVLVSDDGNGELAQRQTTLSLILAGVTG